MYCIKKNIAANEEKKLCQKILNFYDSKERYLNIISVPYNSSAIFINVILKCILEDKKVLYITGEREGSISIIDELKKYTLFREYEYIRNKKNAHKKNFCICDIETSAELTDGFDIYIYDDISSFSEDSSLETINYMKRSINNSAKMIFFTIESIKDCSEISYPIANNRQPLVEPRILMTRLDLNRDIPLEAFEYIKYSLSLRRNIVIYVPTASIAVNTSDILRKYCNGSGINVLYHIKAGSNMKTAMKFIKVKNTIMVTDDCSDIFINCKDMDVMIFFADNEVFNYKKLLYICSRAGRRIEQKRGEAILLAREDTYEMKKAKNIAQNFNKEAWENGLLTF